MESVTSSDVTSPPAGPISRPVPLAASAAPPPATSIEPLQAIASTGPTQITAIAPPRTILTAYECRHRGATRRRCYGSVERFLRLRLRFRVERNHARRR